MVFEDCRGIACPEPVIRLKNALERSGDGEVRIVVDNGASRENVLRFARSQGCTLHEEAFENGWLITLRAGVLSSDERIPATSRHQSVILIGSDKLGEGPDELGRLLMKNFIISLLELATPPETIFFINSGVMLAADGSEALEPLQKLEEKGTELFACGVCLDFFGLRDRLAAGSVTNMYTIADKLLSSGNSIKI
jgi:selenium metabolism protein YedF